MIAWEKLTRDDLINISEICNRAITLIPQIDKMTLNMDLSAVHVNDCGLNLEQLKDAPNLDFAHDIVGISNNINRNTGKLENCFLPRCAI